MRSLIFFAAIVFVINVAAQQKAVKKTLITLQKGEAMIYGENCLKIKSGGNNAIVATVMNSGGKAQFFIYENGNKKGPFSEITPAMINCGKQNYYSCAKYNNDEDNEVTLNYVETTSDGQVFIKFNGKRMGPYLQVQPFILTANKKNFYAVVMAADMSVKFISGDGKNVEIGGTPFSVLVSPDGSEAHAIVKGTMTMQDLTSGKVDPMKMDYTTMSDVYMVNINGKKSGPFKEQSLSASNIWYCKTNNNLLYYTDGAIYLDGKKFMVHDDDPICNVWIAADNKTYAISNYQKIVFSDGESYAFPVEIDCITENGKTYIVWAALENETNLVLYKKEF